MPGTVTHAGDIIPLQRYNLHFLGRKTPVTSCSASNLGLHVCIFPTASFCACSVMSNFLPPHGLQRLPDSSVHGIFLARLLEWVALSYSRGSSWLRDRTYVSCLSCIGRQILYHCTTIAHSLSNTLVKVLLNLKEFSLSAFPWRKFSDHSSGCHFGKVGLFWVFSVFFALS